MKFRVVFRIPSTTYGYYDVEAADQTALSQMLADPQQVREIIAEGACHSEATEIDENADWVVEEVGVGTP